MKITEKANKQTSTSIPMKFLKHITQQVNSMTTAMIKGKMTMTITTCTSHILANNDFAVILCRTTM